MAKNFHINKTQAIKLSRICDWTADDDVVINSESYDADEGSFEFAAKFRETMHPSMWEQVAAHIGSNGWAFYIMDADGRTDPVEEK